MKSISVFSLTACASLLVSLATLVHSPAEDAPPPVFLRTSEFVTESTRDWGGPGQPVSQWQDGKWSRKETWKEFKPITDPVFTSFGFLREKQWLWENKALAKDVKDRTAGFPRIGRNIMAPGKTELAVKRWISTVEGEITVVVDVQCLEPSGNGQLVFFLHNGVKIHLDSLHTADPKKQDCRTSSHVVKVVPGDCLDFAVDSRGGLTGDWTYVNVSISKGRSIFEGASLHMAFDENFEIPTRSEGAKRDRSLRFVDSSGQNHHGSLVNAKDDYQNRPMWVPGVCGNALSFGHDRTYGKLDDGNLLADAEEFTVSVWVAPGIPGKDEKPGIFTTSGRDSAGLNLVAGKNGLEPQFKVHFNTGPLKETNDVLPAQGVKVVNLVRAHNGSAMLPYQWTHLTGTWKSGQFLRLYVNGKLVHEATKSGTVPTGKLDVMQCLVGADFQGKDPRPLNGSIDELTVWPTALTAEQVSAVYRATNKEAPALAAGGMNRLRRESWGNLNAPTVDALYRTPAFLKGTKKVQMMGVGTTGFFTGTKKAERIRGWITAPEDGDYLFWLTLRGDGELSLSPDSSKFRKKTLIAMGEEFGTGNGVQHTHRHPFEKFDAQASSPVRLRKGEKYYVEMVQTLGNRRKSISSIAWQTPSGERQILPGGVCSFYQGEENDQDDDCLPDDWERKYGLDPSDAGAIDLAGQGERGDFDGDGLANRMEFLAGTDPANPDTDGDGLSDAQEVQTYGTDPLKVDEKRGDLITLLDLSATSGSPSWTFLNGTLISNTFRGEVSWDFTVPEEKAYYYDISLRTTGGSAFAPPLPVTVSLDGRPIHISSINFGGAAEKLLRAPGPVIGAGKHRLSLAFDNDRLSRSVGITAVSIFAPLGLDSDQNGMPEWYVSLLQNGTNLLTNPSRSRVSPLFLEGRAAQPRASVLINGQPAQAFGDHGWYADVPLTDSTNALSIQYPDGRSESFQTRWTATNLLETQTLTLRMGDTLRLKAIDADGVPVAASVSIQSPGMKDQSAQSQFIQISAAIPHLQIFDQPGTWSLTTTRSQGMPPSILTVKTLAARLPALIPVVLKQTRNLTVPEISESINAPTLTYSGSEGLKVDRLPADPSGSNRLRLLSSSGGQLALAARLSPAGPILATTAVPSIVIADAMAQDSTQAYQSGAPQGFYRVMAPLVILHLPETVTVEIDIFRSGVMFRDGTRQRIMRRADFDKDNLAVLEFFFPKTLSGGFCHYIDIKDADGTSIGRR